MNSRSLSMMESAYRNLVHLDTDLAASKGYAVRETSAA